MSSTQSIVRPASTLQVLRVSAAGLIASALMLPMLVSGFLFPTYDIAMASLLPEILRQLNIAFVFSEIAVIIIATQRGFRVAKMLACLDRKALVALGVFLTTFAWGGLLFSASAPFATLFNLTYVVHLVFAGAVAHLSRSMQPSATTVIVRIVTIALVVFAAMIALRFLNPPLGRPIETIKWQFAIPGFISVRLFGAMAAAWAAAALYLSLTHCEGRRSLLWSLSFVAITCGMVVWSGTRAGVLGVGVSGLVALFAFGLRPPPRAILFTAGAVLGGSVVAWLLLPYGDTDFWLFVPGEYGGSADGVSSGRLSYWLATWHAFLQVPLFGAGPGATFWILPPDIVKHVQPHNIVLQFLLSWGVVATAAAFFLVASAVWAVHRRARKIAAAVPYVLVADCLLAMALVDGTFHFAQHLMIWVAMMGIALGIPDERAPQAAH